MSSRTMINDEWHRWCRLCAKEDPEEQRKIFGRSEGGEDSESAMAIRKYFEVKIHIKDKISKVLCSECHSLVTSLITFNTRVQSVQAMYRHLLNKESVQSEDIQEARFRYGLMDDDECEQLEQIEEDEETHIKIEKLWSEGEEDELAQEQTDLVVEELDEVVLPAEESIVVTKVEEHKPKVKKVTQTKPATKQPRKGRRTNSVKLPIPISIRQDTVKYTRVGGSSSASNSAAKVVVRKDTIKYNVKNALIEVFDGQIIETLDESEGDTEIHEDAFNGQHYEMNFDGDGDAPSYNGKRRKINNESETADSDHDDSTAFKQKFECNVCGKRYKYQSAFCKHMEELHKVKIEKDDISQPETPPFVELLNDDEVDDDAVLCDVSCKRCGQQFNTNADLNQHTENVHLICSICGHRSRGFDFLKDHIQSHKRYKCEVCQRTFNSLYKLEQHTAIHKGTCSAAKPFQYTSATTTK